MSRSSQTKLTWLIINPKPPMLMIVLFLLLPFFLFLFLILFFLLPYTILLRFFDLFLFLFFFFLPLIFFSYPLLLLPNFKIDITREKSEWFQILTSARLILFAYQSVEGKGFWGNFVATFLGSIYNLCISRNLNLKFCGFLFFFSLFYIMHHFSP